MLLVIKRNRVSFLLLSIICLISFIIRVVWLGSIPANISGDEVTNLCDVLKIIYGAHPNMFSLMGDGSVGGIYFFWPALFVKLIGVSGSIFALRLSISILSILALIPFYLLLKAKTSAFFGFVFTLLLSTNYVFLNFSRTAWVNVVVVFTGLFLMFFIEKGMQKRQDIWFVLAGVFASLTFWGYHYGRVLAVCFSIYLLLQFFLRKYRSFTYAKQLLFYIFFALMTSLPFLILIVSTKPSWVLARETTVFVFTRENIKKEGLKKIFSQQFGNTFLGLIILDKKVMSEGVEDRRYVPIFTTPVNPVIAYFFYLSLIYLVIIARKEFILWKIAGVTTFLVVAVTELPPNFGRAIFYIPFMYFIIGCFVYKVSVGIRRRYAFVNRYLLSFAVVFALCSSLLFFRDLSFYFRWMGTEQVAAARQPAISYSEFPVWQEYQIERIRQGKRPFTNYEWYMIRGWVLSSQSLGK